MNPSQAAMREKAARLLRVTALVALCLCSELSQGAVGKVDKEVFIGETLQFLNETGVPLGQDWKWRWTFGDGTTKPEGNATKYYEKSGTYDVMLTVLIPVGDGHLEVNATSPIRVLVKPIIPKIAPLPPEPFYPGQKIEFKNLTNGPQGMEYQWDFGNNEVKTGENVTHFFTAHGDKTVTLRITAPNDVKVNPVTLKALISEPSLQITADPTELKAGGKVTFATDYPGPPNVKWHWELGDGTISEQQTPQPHKYENDGNYEVQATCTLTDANGTPLPGIQPIKSNRLAITVKPKFEQPEILAIRIEEEEEGKGVNAEGNYTIHVVVETNGTIDELKIDIAGLDSRSMNGTQAQDGIFRHDFQLTEPTPSISQAAVIQTLNITVTATPANEPEHQSRTLEKTIDISVTPQRPAWFLYAIIAVCAVLVGIVAWLIKLAMRPVVPGKITINNEDHWLTSSPLGPKKGSVIIKLSNYDIDYSPIVMTVTATGNRSRPEITLLLEGGEGEISANGLYYQYGRPFSAKEEMNLDLGGGKYLTFDPETGGEYTSWDTDDF